MFCPQHSLSQVCKDKCCELSFPRQVQYSDGGAYEGIPNLFCPLQKLLSWWFLQPSWLPGCHFARQGRQVGVGNIPHNTTKPTDFIKMNKHSQGFCKIVVNFQSSEKREFKIFLFFVFLQGQQIFRTIYFAILEMLPSQYDLICSSQITKIEDFLYVYWPF